MQVHFLVVVASPSHCTGGQPCALCLCLSLFPSIRPALQTLEKPSCPEGSEEGVCVSARRGRWIFHDKWRKMGDIPRMKTVLRGGAFITPLLASGKSVDVSDFRPTSPLASCRTLGRAQ